MSKTSKAFGFYPESLRIDAGAIQIDPLPPIDEVVRGVLAGDQVEDGWIYAPPQGVRDLMSGQIRQRPYSARVFGLPQTHMIEHAGADGDEHLDFLVWALSFFVGMRLTTTEADFLDATPARRGTLVDFVMRTQDISKGMELAERFWTNNRHEPRNAQRFAAAVHALFLGQNPRALQFEEFIYLYTAVDACYKLAAELRQPTKKKLNRERIEWMCGEFGLETPDWAKQSVSGGVEVAAIRNDALHEALYVDAPLGFAVHGADSFGNLPLEMVALICRLLMALIGGNDSSYVGSAVDTRQAARSRIEIARVVAARRYPELSRPHDPARAPAFPEIPFRMHSKLHFRVHSRKMNTPITQCISCFFCCWGGRFALRHCGQPPRGSDLQPGQVDGCGRKSAGLAS